MNMQMPWRSTLVGIVLGGLLANGAIAALAGNARSQQSSTGPTADPLQIFLAEREIRQQIHNYARGIDRQDRELLVRVFHPDATVEGTEFKGTAAEWIKGALGSAPPNHTTSHQMASSLIKLDGERASSETYFEAWLHTEPDSNSATTNVVRARYADRWAKRNGRWAITSRTIIRDIRFNMNHTGPNGGKNTRRDQSDPSYKILF
jgi:hypothetical protein